MESYLERRKEDFNKSTNNSNNKQINYLIQEYCLKRGQFNPKKNSPNKFCNKLEFRMKRYYNALYTLSSSPPK